MSLSALLAFALILSVGVATPGPTVLLAMSNGSRYGLRHAMVGMLGAVTADVVLVALVGCGLGVLLDASETAFVTLKLAGAAWLAYVGVRMLLSSGGSAAGARSRDARSPDRVPEELFRRDEQPEVLPVHVGAAAAVRRPVARDRAAVRDPRGDDRRDRRYRMTGYAVLGVHSVRVWKAAGRSG